MSHTTIETATDLQKEYFDFDVTFTAGLEKWENHNHPENPDFCQVVNWVCWEKTKKTITVAYYLDKTNSQKNNIYKTVPMNGKTFRQVVFEIWCNDSFQS